MQALATYIKRFVALAVACVLVCGLVPAEALARTAAGDLGLRLQVPKSAFVDQGDGTRAADALLGVRIEVPKSAFVGDGDNDTDTRSADGMMGIRLQVPSQAYVDPGAGDQETRAVDGMLGIRLEVPAAAFVDPGDGEDVRAAEGLFGIRLQVPSQAFVGDDDNDTDTRSADGLVGIRLQVPSQAYIEPGDDTSAASGIFGIRLSVATTHTVTFDPNRGEGGEGGKALTVLDGATVDEPDPVMATKDGWRVEGWYLDAACTERYDFSQPVYRDFTLFANWIHEAYDRAEFRLHLMADDAVLPDAGAYTPGADDHGDYLASEYEVEKGMMLPAPTRTGYDFAGWYAGWSADGGHVGEPVEYISRHETADPAEYWAKWEPRPPAEGDYWTVEFDVLGGSYVEPQYIDVEAGGCAVRPEADPVKSGHVFDGWYSDALCMRPFDFDAPITGDTVVYAKWKPTSTTSTSYTVMFDSQGGSTVGRQQVREGACAARPATPTRAGYDFVGWYVDADAAAAAGEEGLYDFATPVMGNLTLYAGWREKPKLTVTFEANGGSFEDEGLSRIEVKVTEGSMVAPEDVPADPRQAGWQFSGWHLAAEGGEGTGGPGGGSGGSGVALGEKWDPTAPVHADTTVYAGWTLRLDVTVPVSVGFAVDAASGNVTTPDMGAYALKSRTVREVTVDALALESDQGELDGFFALPEGALPEEASASDEVAAWRHALSATSLSVGCAGADAVRLALAGDMVDVGEGATWTNSYTLTDGERASYSIGAFSYASSGAAFDAAWQGQDPSQSLPLEFGMTIPMDRLEVRTDLTGSVPLTHLKLTVSARQ